MHTTTQTTTDHTQAVTAISDALDLLTAALDAEKAAREASLEIHPALKFTIRLSNNAAKPYAFVDEWRNWAKSSGQLKGE